MLHLVLTLLLQLYIRSLQLEWGGRITPRGISSSRADRKTIPAATPVFGVKLFNGGVGDFANRAVQLQIQDGGRKVEKKTKMFVSRLV